MRFEELLEYNGPKTKRVNYRKALLVHTVEPDKSGNYVGKIYYNDDKMDIDNPDLDALIKDFQNKINQLEIADRKQSLQKRDAADLTNSTGAGADFNTAFTRIILEDGVPTAGRLGEENGKLILDIMTREWFDNFGTEDSDGFKKITDRQWGSKKEGTTKVYGIGSYKPEKLAAMGFEYNGVYSLEVADSPDPEMFTRYGLDHIGYSDKKTSYPVPAVTIAFWYKRGMEPKV